MDNKKRKIFSHPIIVTIITGVVLAILTGTSSPWWWPMFFKKTNEVDTQKFVNQNLNAHRDQKVSINKVDDGLRPLKPLETGQKISDLANGVYFFANSPNAVVYEIKDPKTDFLNATNQPEKNFTFEIQKIDNRYYLIGFVSDEDFAKTGNVSSENSLYLTIFPSELELAKNIIAIPFDKVYTINDRVINLDAKTDVYVLDVGFKEVKQGFISHT